MRAHLGVGDTILPTLPFLGGQRTFFELDEYGTSFISKL
jgi:hypothetical protein